MDSAADDTHGLATGADLARVIAARLDHEADALSEMWRSAPPFRHFVVDDLLPEALAHAIAAATPPIAGLLHRSSLRERKKVGVELEQYDPLVTSALTSFHEPEVIAAVGRIVGSDDLYSDPSLYASGISVMERGDFLNPHVDNSHDGDRIRYRALNLLYYVTPGWRLEDGGNLELWTPERDAHYTVESRFNRLVVMGTHRQSWHSVSRVGADAARWCVSNYYFSDSPPEGVDYRHVTTFAGRPEEPVKKLLLRVDGIALNALGRALPILTRLTRHRRRTG
jgi:Rps23 Pro-64 3,4-dihydroxylase Tpa1-like proline 4-hydroxylase